MKVITRNGDIHYLKWLEEKDGNAYSIINTKRVFVKKNKVERYQIYRPDPTIVSLEAALLHKGKVEILTWKYIRGKNKVLVPKYEFIDMVDRGEYIRGIEVVSKGKEPVIFIIPFDQIEAINLLNQDFNAGMSILVFLGAMAGLVYWGLSSITFTVFP